MIINVSALYSMLKLNGIHDTCLFCFDFIDFSGL